MLNIRLKPHIFVSKNGNLFPSFANFTPVNGENKPTTYFFLLLHTIPK